MTRMALLLALVVVTLSVLSYIFGNSLVLILAAFFLLCAIVCFIFRRKFKYCLSVVAVLVLCAAFGVYLSLFNIVMVQKTEELAGHTATIEGTVIDEPEPHGELSIITFKSKGITEDKTHKFKNVKLQMWVNCEDDLYYATSGDTFSATVTFNEVHKDYRKTKMACGVYVSGVYKNVMVTGHKSNFYEYAISIRQAVRDKINQNFSGDKRGILNGVVLGDNSALSDELYNDFIISGVIHITSVSGLHISIICAAITTVFQMFMRRRRAALFAMFPLLLVIAVTGFNASAIRAGIMCFFAFFGEVFLKKSDGLNSLGLAVTIMLIINPYYVCDLGFALSCTATAGVVVATKIYNDYITLRFEFKNKYVNKILHIAGTIIFQSVGAVIFTLPLQIMNYGFVSLAAPLGGVAICASVSYLLVIAVFAITLSFIPVVSIVSKGLFAILWLLSEYIETVIPIIADIPFSYVAVSGVFILFWMGASFGLIGIWFILRKIGGKRLLVLLITSLFIVTLCCGRYVLNKTVEISSINLQKGYSVVIYSGEKCVIIGCGDDTDDAYTIYKELRLHGVTKVETLLLPSDWEVCSKGAKRLCELLRYDEQPYLPIASELHENIVPNVDLEYNVYEGGCYYKATVFDKTVIIGFGSYETQYKADVLFSGRALPIIKNAKQTVISGGYLNEIDKKYGKTCFSADKTISLKFAEGKEIKVYARQYRFSVFN